MRTWRLPRRTRTASPGIIPSAVEMFPLTTEGEWRSSIAVDLDLAGQIATGVVTIYAETLIGRVSLLAGNFTAVAGVQRFEVKGRGALYFTVGIRLVSGAITRPVFLTATTYGTQPTTEGNAGTTL